MRKKYICNIVAMFLLVVSCLCALFGGYSIVIKHANSGEVFALEESKVNTQVYDSGNGMNTIYWAQGIKPPKMVKYGDAKEGTTGYFTRNEETDLKEPERKYVVYNHEMENNKGYYDFNKNLSTSVSVQVGHHCYLAVGINLIHWWLEQNAPYIETYRQNLQNGVYSQLDGLVKIDEYNNSLWDNIMEIPQLKNNGNYIAQDLDNDYIYKNVLTPYLSFNSGYYTDVVLDNFFNGYYHFDPDKIGVENEIPAENTMDRFKPSLTGGYFYPLFYKEKLTQRFEGGKYEYFKKGLKEAFSTGKGVELSYQSAGPAHAITAWGAEYDERGELVRVYCTDSDDYDSTNLTKNNILNGLFSYDIGYLENGRAYLTNDRGTPVKMRSLLLGYQTLDLKQDVLKEKVKDIVAPITPKFETPLKDKGYSSSNTDILPLEANVKREDTGYYEYQWYEATSRNDIGTKIQGATSKRYVPKKPNETPKYYYCEVLNYKNGKVSEIGKTNWAKIYIQEGLKDALKPALIKEKSYKFDLTQYQNPPKLKVNAYSRDGGEISYQWYYKTGINLTPTGGKLLIGETRNFIYPEVTCSSFNPEDITQHLYYCVITNVNNIVNGNPVAKESTPMYKVSVIRGAEFNTALNPIIKENSKSTTYNSLSEIKDLFVNAKVIDGGEISYQWYLNSQKIIGANNSSYTPEIKTAGSYEYKCVIKNTNNSAKITKVVEVETEPIIIQVNEGEAYIPSSNANLSSLSVSGKEINPKFESGQTEYNLTVEYDVTSITINATAKDEKAKSVIGTGNKQLNEGLNTFEIVVTAENGEEKTYILKVTRNSYVPPYVESDNNDLLSLSVENHRISPEFRSDNLIYTLTVNYNVESINILATAKDEKAKSVIGTGVKELIEGLNTFEIVVTAENGEKKTYTLKVTREEELINPEPDTPSNPDDNKEPEIQDGLNIDKEMLTKILYITLIVIGVLIVIVVISLIIVSIKNR